MKPNYRPPSKEGVKQNYFMRDIPLVDSVTAHSRPSLNTAAKPIQRNYQEQPIPNVVVKIKPYKDHLQNQKVLEPVPQLVNRPLPVTDSVLIIEAIKPRLSLFQQLPKVKTEYTHFKNQEPKSRPLTPLLPQPKSILRNVSFKDSTTTEMGLLQRKQSQQNQLVQQIPVASEEKQNCSDTFTFKPKHRSGSKQQNTYTFDTGIQTSIEVKPGSEAKRQKNQPCCLMF